MAPQPRLAFDPEIWPALSRLLDEWLGQPAHLRAAWLDNLDAEHDRAARELKQIVAMREWAGFESFLVKPPALPHSTDSPASFAPGATVGPYRLIRELGHGGMGVVWLAERADGTLKRPVA